MLNFVPFIGSKVPVLCATIKLSKSIGLEVSLIANIYKNPSRSGFRFSKNKLSEISFLNLLKLFFLLNHLIDLTKIPVDINKTKLIMI